MRIEAQWTDEDVADAGTQLRKLERVLARVRLTAAVLERASLPMPTIVKTPDAIHIASASLIRERTQSNLLFVTHDPQQGRAARALGFETLPEE
jgi:hypothetical protein